MRFDHKPLARQWGTLYYWTREIKIIKLKQEGRKEMFYLTTHSTHFIYGYMATDIW